MNELNEREKGIIYNALLKNCFDDSGNVKSQKLEEILFIKNLINKFRK